MRIRNFDHIIPSIDFDIIHEEKILLNEKVNQSSELILENSGIKTRIKFELVKEHEIGEDDFLFIPETNFLFYCGINEWCAFDLRNKCIVRNESATQFPFSERIKDVVLIYDELYVESMDLKAKRIDIVPIDPPTESIFYSERIEFDSPVNGIQTLKLK